MYGAQVAHRRLLQTCYASIHRNSRSALILKLIQFLYQNVQDNACVACFGRFSCLSSFCTVCGLLKPADFISRFFCKKWMFVTSEHWALTHRAWPRQRIRRASHSISGVRWWAHWARTARRIETYFQGGAIYLDAAYNYCRFPYVIGSVKRWSII